MSDFLLPDAPELFDVGDDDDDEDDDSSDDDEFGLSDIDAAELRIDDESDEGQSTEGNSVEQVTRSVDSRHDVLQEAAQLANVESQAHPTSAKSAFWRADQSLTLVIEWRELIRMALAQ